ncbi:hypothetical protein [Nocardioides convexus]|uniref:hypothetical protein n=1 Tax=Nocardioides convexus TaxID=2712224 RepID=UPI002418ABAE|nr:hypothetical protein [Nocardioides convexus]
MTTRTDAEERRRSPWPGSPASGSRRSRSSSPRLEDIPIKDPDSLIPGYIRFPAIVLGAIAIDVVPRILYAAGRPASGWGSRLRTSARTVMRERWPASHWKFALNGVAAWYLCYAAFRNVKSMAPFVHEKIYDAQARRHRPVPLRRPRPGVHPARVVRHRPRGALLLLRLHRVDRAGAGLHRDRAGVDPAHPRRRVVRHRGGPRLGARRRALRRAADRRPDLLRPRHLRGPARDLRQPARRLDVGRPGQHDGQPRRVRPADDRGLRLAPRRHHDDDLPGRAGDQGWPGGSGSPRGPSSC